jgi:hypothetical protein
MEGRGEGATGPKGRRKGMEKRRGIRVSNRKTVFNANLQN